MKTIIYNAVNAKIQLQDSFTARQLELIRADTTPETGGFDTLYANEYRGKIYIENLTGVVLNIIEKPASNNAIITFNPYFIRYDLEVYSNDRLVSRSNHISRDEAEFYFISNYINNAVATYTDYIVDYKSDMDTINRTSVIPELDSCNSLILDGGVSC